MRVLVVGLSALCVLAAACGPSTDTDQAEADAAERALAAAEALAAARLASLPAPYADADLANGRLLWRRCNVCHMIAPEGRPLVGPNIYGLFDRRVGESEGFRYSQALLNADFTWTPEDLDLWLANPRTFLPGNRMAFAGLPTTEARRDLIAYIMVEAGYDPDTAAQPASNVEATELSSETPTPDAPQTDAGETDTGPETDQSSPESTGETPSPTPPAP